MLGQIWDISSKSSRNTASAAEQLGAWGKINRKNKRGRTSFLKPLTQFFKKIPAILKMKWLQMIFFFESFWSGISAPLTSLEATCWYTYAVITALSKNPNLCCRGKTSPFCSTFLKLNYARDRHQIVFKMLWPWWFWGLDFHWFNPAIKDTPTNLSFSWCRAGIDFYPAD